jgi:hypothetical protein
MGVAVVVGPYKTLEIGEGKTAELHLLRYGADGGLLSPETEKILKQSLGGVTDVFLFSHGWNNTFADAASNYLKFIKGYTEQRAEFNLPLPVDYQPATMAGAQ